MEPIPASDYDRMMDRLTVIYGYLELLENGTYGHVNPRQSQVLKDLLREAHTLGVLLRDTGAETGSPPGPL